MTTEQQASNFPTVSRTIRLQECDFNIDVEHSLFKADNGKQFITFNTVEDAKSAFTQLKEANIRGSFLTYSLFVKSQNELNENDLREHILNLIPHANITYIRIDNNLHTGKVVVDLLTDYQTVKSSSSTELKFFHFDPKRVKSNRPQQRQGRNNETTHQQAVSRESSNSGRGSGRSGGRGSGRSSGRGSSSGRTSSRESSRT